MTIERIVNSVFTSNTFIITENNYPYCWLIDVGDVDPIFGKIKNKVVKGILLTHVHYDHIYGINKVMNLFPDCMVFTSADGRDALYSDKLNFSRYHDDPIILESDNVAVLKENDKIDLFPDIILNSIYTPGHDKSCITYYNDNVIFTGDSYIPNIKVVTSFPRSNKEDAARSLEIILKLTETRSIYPGHNECYIKNRNNE